MRLRGLFGGALRKSQVSQERLPVLHSFVSVTVTGRPSRSAAVESVGAREIVLSDMLGRPGQRAAIAYETPAGRFRFGATIRAVRGGMTIFASPSRVDPIGDGQKRNAVRMDVLIRGAWRFAPSGEAVGDFQRASVGDISRGGCSLILDRQCKVGKTLEVRLTLCAAQELTVLADVTRCEQIPTSGKFSHGLRFRRLSAQEDRAIAEFIAGRAAQLRERGLA